MIIIAAMGEKRRPPPAAAAPELDPLATTDLILLGLKPTTTEEVGHPKAFGHLSAVAVDPTQVDW